VRVAHHFVVRGGLIVRFEQFVDTALVRDAASQVVADVGRRHATGEQRGVKRAKRLYADGRERGFLGGRDAGEAALHRWVCPEPCVGPAPRSGPVDRRPAGLGAWAVDTVPPSPSLRACPFASAAALEQRDGVRGVPTPISLVQPAGSGGDPARELRVRSSAVRFFWSASGRVCSGGVGYWKSRNSSYERSSCAGSGTLFGLPRRL
jgi:hypothetical protein